MKFKFDSILEPTIDLTNRNAVLGRFADGATIKVDRHSDGWNVNLRIAVNDVLWHDCKAMPEEQAAFDILRDRAFINESNKADAQREDSRQLAAMWLLGNA